jgi:hypothetical protein
MACGRPGSPAPPPASAGVIGSFVASSKDGKHVATLCPECGVGRRAALSYLRTGCAALWRCISPCPAPQSGKSLSLGVSSGCERHVAPLPRYACQAVARASHLEGHVTPLSRYAKDSMRRHCRPRGGGADACCRSLGPCISCKHCASPRRDAQPPCRILITVGSLRDPDTQR